MSVEYRENLGLNWPPGSPASVSLELDIIITSYSSSSMLDRLRPLGARPVSLFVIKHSREIFEWGSRTSTPRPSS